MSPPDRPAGGYRNAPHEDTPASLLAQREGSVVTLTINRPDRRNALDAATYGALSERIAQASADTGRQVHMHLLETRYQREWADHAFPQGIVAYLRDIGLLGPRLTLAHCTWARPEELALIAESGACIAVNTGSNLGIRSGIAPLAQMLAAGCRVAMGLDGLALDEDDDALRELRLLPGRELDGHEWRWNVREESM